MSSNIKITICNPINTESLNEKCTDVLASIIIYRTSDKLMNDSKDDFEPQHLKQNYQI